MKRLLIAAAIACLAACSPPVAQEEAYNGPPNLDGVMLPLGDMAEHRMEALTQNGARWCTEDNVWCVEGGTVTASFIPGSPPIALPSEGEVWPAIIRDGETALVGVISEDQQMYSGGGGSAQHVTLYEIANGAAREVLRMPYAASAMIRACFSEEDETTRGGACHDEYAFVTRIFIDETNTSPYPVIMLETAAGSYPGPLTRAEDSAERGPLTEADLVWAQDAECTFSRTYTRAEDGLYAPDQPLPGCADYLEP